MSSRNEESGGGPSDPFYNLRISSGGNDPKRTIPQPYNLLSRSYMRSPATRSYYGSLDYPYLRQGLMSNPPAFSGFDENLLQSKLKTMITGHDLNLSLTVAEPIKTLKTVVSSAKAIGMMGRGLRTGNLQLALRAVGALPGQTGAKDAGRKLKLGDVAGALLALRYCWEPIMNDAFAAYDAIRVANQEPRKLFYKASRRVPYTGEDSRSSTIYSLPCKGFRTVTYRIWLVEQVTMDRSLNVIDPAAVIWENIPASFIFDWFIPIGTMLQNLSFFGNLKQTTVRTDFSYSEADTRWGTKWPSKPPMAEMVKQDSFRSICRTMTRTVLHNQVPLAFPSGKQVAAALSTVHLQNAAAMIFAAVASYASPKIAAREQAALLERNAQRKATQLANRKNRWSRGIKAISL